MIACCCSLPPACCRNCPNNRIGFYEFRPYIPPPPPAPAVFPPWEEGETAEHYLKRLAEANPGR